MGSREEVTPRERRSQLSNARGLVANVRGWLRVHKKDCGCSLDSPCDVVVRIAEAIDGIIAVTPELELLSLAEADAGIFAGPNGGG